MFAAAIDYQEQCSLSKVETSVVWILAKKLPHLKQQYTKAFGTATCGESFMMKDVDSSANAYKVFDSYFYNSSFSQGEDCDYNKQEQGLKDNSSSSTFAAYGRPLRNAGLASYKQMDVQSDEVSSSFEETSDDEEESDSADELAYVDDGEAINNNNLKRSTSLFSFQISKKEQDVVDNDEGCKTKSKASSDHELKHVIPRGAKCIQDIVDQWEKGCGSNCPPLKEWDNNMRRNERSLYSKRKRIYMEYKLLGCSIRNFNKKWKDMPMGKIYQKLSGSNSRSNNITKKSKWQK